MGIPATLSSVPAQTPYIQYVATSGQTVFPYPFEITQDSDLVAVANGTTLATDSGYTLSGVGNSTGGNLTFTSGRAAGDIITLYRGIPIERLTQFAQNGGFSSTAFNAEFNNVYLLLQQLQTSIDQCLQIPNTNNPAPTVSLTPGAYASKYLAFDANGNPTPAALTSSGSLTQATIAGLLTPQTSAEQTAGATVVQAQYAPGNVLRYGANSIPGTTDMGAAIQAAVDQHVKGGPAAYVPAGIYYVGSAVITLSSNVRLYGDGSSSVINFGSTANQDCITGYAVSNTRVEDLKLNIPNEQASGSYVGAVAFRGNSQYCAVRRCEITGCTGAGVLLVGSSYCTIEGNYFHSFTYGAGDNDSSDIHVGTPGPFSTTITAGNASITCTNTLRAGDAVQFPSGSAFGSVTGFTTGTTYYVSATGLSGTALQLSASNGGAVITPAGSGSATPNLLTAYGSSYNIIKNNQCFGGNNIGISLETSSTPNELMQKNIVDGNRVGTHTAYGILAYCHQTGDTYTQITNNYVENITGTSPNQTGSAGAGIYLLGMSATKIIGNTVVGSAQQTQNQSLVPGGIGVNVTSGSPCDIIGNSVYDISPGNPWAGASFAMAGINCQAIPVGSTISGNTVSQQVSPGSNVSYCGILVSCQGVTVSGNSVDILNSISSTRGIFVYANGANTQNVLVTGNEVVGCSAKQITFEQNGGFTNQSITVSGNTCTNGASGCTPLNITSTTNGTIAGNTFNANATVPVILASSTGVVISGNLLDPGSGATYFTTSGTCTGSFFDKSNGVVTLSGINNAGTGCRCEFYNSATPGGGTGTAAVGDTCYNTVPTSTGSFLWVCTTAGTAGTWTALTLP